AARLGAAASAAGSGTTPQDSSHPPERAAARPSAPPVLAALVQRPFPFIGPGVWSGFAYFLLVPAVPFGVWRFAVEATLLLLPVLWTLGLWLYSPLAVALVVVVKRVAIGRYRRVRAPVWGHFYVRHWMVQTTARLVPWRRLEGTIFLNGCLRALGA